MAEIKRDWKIGDKFRVKSKEQIVKELDDNDETNGIKWIDEMYEFCGIILKVEDYDFIQKIVAKTDIGKYTFAYEWIEPVYRYPWSKYVSVE
jgi:hypothetical protein